MPPPNSQQPSGGGAPTGGQGYQGYQAPAQPQAAGAQATQMAGSRISSQANVQAAVAAGPPRPGSQATQPGIQRGAPTNPNSTQNTLQIAEIRDGIAIMGDGSFRSVVMVKSINYDLMSREEQEAVEYSYQGFLNSLHFPIQIFIRSQRVDLQPYIEKLDRIRNSHDNMLLSMLMDDYIGFIEQLSQQTNIMDKKFYIAIPYFPHVDVKKKPGKSKNFFTGLVDMLSSKEKHVVIDEENLQQAKDELRNRVQAVLSGLLQCGIKGLPLDTQELIEMYYDVYNPDTATRQHLKNIEDLDADVITKGQGPAQAGPPQPPQGAQQ